jgi:hypothetical protein
MSPKTELTAGPGVQIVKLTMENDENQDELNRRLRKPREAEAKKGKSLNDTATRPSNGAEQGRCT